MPRAAAAAEALAVLRAHAPASRAQHEIERRIVSGEIAAGSKLDEADPVGALGVSRGPVREAFRALARAGRVRVETNCGVLVREVSPDEAHELCEVRAAPTRTSR